MKTKFVTFCVRVLNFATTKLQSFLGAIAGFFGMIFTPLCNPLKKYCPTLLHRFSAFSPAVLFGVLCAFSVFSQIDVVSAFAPVRYGVMVLWLFAFFFFAANAKLKLNKWVLGALLPVILFDIVILLCGIFFRNIGAYLAAPITYAVNLSAFVFAIGAFASHSADGNIIKTGAKIYILCAVLIGIYTILTTFWGVWFSSDVYLYSRKNSLAPIIVTAAASIMFLKLSKHIALKTLLLCFFIFFVMLLRSRASLLGLIAAYIVWYIFALKGIKAKWIVLAITVVTVTLIITVEPLHEFFIDNILLNNRGDLGADEFTSGRSSQLSDLFADGSTQKRSFKSAMLFGMGATYVECMPLASLFSFGCIASGFLGLFALVPLFSALKSKKHPVFVRDALFLTALSAAFLLNCLFEERAPFGPGITYCFFWFTAGFCLGKQKDAEAQ